MKDYLQQHPDWDEKRLLTAAVPLFLLQHGDGDRLVGQVYLEAMFHRS
jgi:hypothetical protein